VVFISSDILEHTLNTLQVLVVDPDRKRIALTAKKTLVESELPIISKLEDAKVGMVTHAVVYKVLDKAILVEFFNNLRAQVPLKEARYDKTCLMATEYSVSFLQ